MYIYTYVCIRDFKCVCLYLCMVICGAAAFHGDPGTELQAPAVCLINGKVAPRDTWDLRDPAIPKISWLENPGITLTLQNEDHYSS